MTLSVLVALIFTPALCATLLAPVEKGIRKSARFLRLVQSQLRAPVAATSAA
jgi:multidrug efflux pump subunit AcrB